MKAVQVVGPSQLEVTDLPVPEAGDHALVRIDRAGMIWPVYCSSQAGLWPAFIAGLESLRTRNEAPKGLVSS